MPATLAQPGPANPRHATGPRTPAGKAASSRNACSHGLLSDAPIATPFEQPAAWQAHRAAFLHELAPLGHLETILVERLALLHWRLARLARHESALIARDQQELAADDLERRFSLPDGRPSSRADLAAERRVRDEHFRFLEYWMDRPERARLPADSVERLLAILLAPLGRIEICLPLLLDAQPGEELAAYCGRQAWTWERLEAVLEPICRYGPTTSVATLKAVALQRAKDAYWSGVRARSDEEIAVLEGCLRLPEDLAVLDRIARYEAHLSRELARTSHELDRLQTQRRARSASEKCQTNSSPPTLSAIATTDTGNATPPEEVATPHPAAASGVPAAAGRPAIRPQPQAGSAPHAAAAGPVSTIRPQPEAGPAPIRPQPEACAPLPTRPLVRDARRAYIKHCETDSGGDSRTG